MALTHDTKPASQSIDVTGSLRLNGEYMNTSTGCAGSGGYSDIAEGAPVIVTDPAGKTVAIGQLKSGAGSAGTCIFRFDVHPVPTGLGFYGVEVSHRGRVQFKESELTGISLTLG
jgi:hypothetical protein